MDEAGAASFKRNGGEVNNAADIGFHERVENRLRRRLGHGEHGELYIVLGDVLFHLADVKNRNGRIRVEQCWLAVESSDHTDSNPWKTVVVHQGAAHLSAANNDDFLFFIFAQNHVQPLQQNFNLIAAAFIASELEHGEVLAHKRRRDPNRIGQVVRKDPNKAKPLHFLHDVSVF